MALFQYNNVLLPYQIHFAPFVHDLLLLQGSKFNSDYWLPVLTSWADEPSGGGRIIICDWQSEGMSGGDLAEYFHRFFQTLGVQNLRAVGSDGGAKVIEDLEADFPGTVAKSLLFHRQAPRGEELRRAVAEFALK